MGNGDPQSAGVDAKQFQSKVVGFMSGACTSNLIYIGDRLGLFKQLKSGGKQSSQQLAQTLGLHERYVREWAFQQVNCTNYHGPLFLHRYLH